MPATAVAWLPGVQDVRLIYDKTGQAVGLLSIETSLIQLERHRQRHRSFRRAIEWLKTMCVRGELAASAGLSPFREADGIVLVDAQRHITYVSGIANNFYRRLGLMEDLRGRKLAFLNMGEDEMVLRAMEKRMPLQQEVEKDGRIFIRKVLPIWPPPTLSGRLEGWLFGRPRPDDVGGVLIMVHDATEERRKQDELQVKVTMIQEVHHRVKNNLQTIAAVLRMQARREKAPGTQQALKEAINRILSVAVIHEYLSLDENQTINVRDVCQRIAGQSREVLLPDQRIDFAVEGPAIYLPSQQATACALVMNELIQNALEHGFEDRKQGTVRVTLTDGGDRVGLEVWDDGRLLPGDFDLDTPSSLGLQIVRSLVQSDLRGQLKVENREQGVSATITFPKTVTAGKRT